MNATELARAKETRCRNCGELIVLDEQEVFWLGTRSWYHDPACPGALLLIPHRFAIAMQASAWIVRNDNVWVRVNREELN